MSLADKVLYEGRIFPGLRPFEPEDAVLFFGREEQTDELLRRLQNTHFLTVVGLSGSGKSSLVRAGLLPALRRGHLAGAGPQWRVCVLRPGSDPLGALARALNNTLGEREDRLLTLRSGTLGLADASRYGRKPDENLLIVVDQFEELFRFREGSRDRTGEDDHFVDVLLAAAFESDPEYAVYIVLTLRSDYVGECARFRRLPEVLNEGQYLVPRMTTSELREAVQGPAALGGLKVAPELLAELIEKTGDDPDQLPILQHLLMRMCDLRQGSSTLTTKQYEEMGGLEDALNRHADDALQLLSPSRQKIAKRIFQRLTDKGAEGRGLRRPTKLRDLVAVAQMPEDEVKAVVKHFREEGCSFLTSPDRELTLDSDIDISHESLIRKWKQLSKWVEEEADWGEWYRRVADRLGVRGALLADLELESALQARNAGEWNEAWATRYAVGGVRAVPFQDVILFLAKSEKQRQGAVNRLRKTRAVIAAVAVVFACLAATAGYLGWRAHQKAKEAEAAEARAADADSQVRKQMIVLSDSYREHTEAEANRLKAEQLEAEKQGLTSQADQLKRSYDAAQKSLEQQKELLRVAQNYYISPYAPGFSLWYGGTWYGSRTAYSSSWYGSRTAYSSSPYYFYGRRGIYERPRP